MFDRDPIEEGRKAIDFLDRHGFRRCDIPACNCGSWHGGHAADRLREIGDALDEANVPREGGIIVKRIAALLLRVEESERDRLREVLAKAADAAESATLPDGYQWGDDAMESFNFGKERAAEAVRALAGEGKS